jgi:hypothetical protein
VGSPPTVTGPKEINRDERFIAYDNGTVIDTLYGLMWAAKDNGSGINWNDAKYYCENYRGGGFTNWRMPTNQELEWLYEPSRGYLVTPKNISKNIAHLTNLIQLSMYFVWSIKDSASGNNMIDFTRGIQNKFSDNDAIWLRALPVRSVK